MKGAQEIIWRLALPPVYQGIAQVCSTLHKNIPQEWLIYKYIGKDSVHDSDQKYLQFSIFLQSSQECLEKDVKTGQLYGDFSLF